MRLSTCEHFGNRRTEPGEMWLSVNCLGHVEELRLRVGAVNCDRAEVRIDNPNDRDARLEIDINLFRNLFMLIRGGEDFDHEQRWTLDISLLIRIRISMLWGQICHVHADAGVRIPCKANASLANEHFTLGFGLRLQPATQ